MFNNRFTKKDVVAESVKSILEADTQKKTEELQQEGWRKMLKGNQYKLDKNKNGKLDAQDFKMLRKEEGELEEGWDDMLKASKKAADEKKKVGSTRQTKTGHTETQTSTGKRYTKNYDEKTGLNKEEVERMDEDGPQKHDIPAYKRKQKGGDWKANLKDVQDRPDTIQGQAKREAEKKRAEYRKEDVEQIQEWPDGKKSDEKKPVGSTRQTKTGHTETQTSTGKRYTKNYDEKTGLNKESADLEEALKISGSHIENSMKEYGTHKTAKAIQGLYDKGHISKREADRHLAHVHRRLVGDTKKYKLDDPRLTREGSETEIDLIERKLTSGEMATREKNVKGMKKNLAGFKARYGDRAKSVMYATATKQAKED